MASLVSNWSNQAESMPANYIMPPERRPGPVQICKNIPVIDLGQAAGHARSDLVQELIKACQEFGLFQVINHGVSEEMMNETMSLYNEFFNMSAEDKASVCSDDFTKSCRLYTSSLNYATEDIHFWKDSLTHPCHPFEEHIKSWPEKPARYREVVSAYAVEVNKMGSRILDLIGEGLGLEVGYFGELTKGHAMAINHYPPCPDPSLAMGIPGHCDPNLITILQQDAYGLQMFKDGKWIGVDYVPNAFVINLSYQMEIISNGKLKSAEHRGAITSSSAARTSIVTLLGPTSEAVIEPAKALLSACNPPRFRAFTYNEFFQNYVAYLVTNPPLSGTPLGPFELQAQN